MFGAQNSSPAFGTPSSTPAFGTPSTPAFGTPSTSSFSSGGAFGTSLFSTPPSQPQQNSLFQTPASAQSSGGFGFSTPFGQTTPAQSSLFGQTTPAQSSLFGQTTPAQSSLFGQTTPGQSSLFGQATPAPSFANAQLTTQMAPVAPLPFSLTDREIQAIVEAYKEDTGNPKYAFKHLLFSVTEPQHRMKPPGVSDILWAEAMGKLEGMESSKRERLWPQLVQGFKDLSERLKLQDDVIVSDSERLQTIQSNVKMLQRHFQADTFPRIQMMRQKEQILHRRLLRVNRIIEALEGKGFRLPLTKGEAELAEKLASITQQLKGSGAELSRRVQNLWTLARVKGNGLGGGSLYLPGSTKIHAQSLLDMQEVLQQQTAFIGRLGNVLKKDVRDMDIMVAEDTEMLDEAFLQMTN